MNQEQYNKLMDVIGEFEYLIDNLLSNVFEVQTYYDDIKSMLYHIEVEDESD